MSNLLFPPLEKALKERNGPGMAVVQEERRKQWLQEQAQHMAERVNAATESNNGDHDTNNAMIDQPPADPESSPAQKSKNSTKEGSHGHTRSYVACEECRKAKCKCMPQNGDVDNPDPNEPCQKCVRERKVCSHTKGENPKRSKRSKLSQVITNGRITHTPKTNASLAVADSITADNDSTPADMNNNSIAANTNYNLTQEDISYVPHNHLDAMRQLGVVVARIEDHQIVPIVFETPPLPALDAAEDAIYRSPAYKDSSKIDQESAFAIWCCFFLCRRSSLVTLNPLEGMGYVMKFFEHLAPLTPVTGLLTNYGPLHMHDKLLKENPVLAMVILVISSRYFEPTAPDGPAHPVISRRAVDIHSALWTMLQKMIHEVTWISGDCDHPILFAGEHDDSTTSCWAGKLKTFSTVEALFLLTEWHSRGLLQPEFTSTCEVVVSCDRGIQPSRMPGEAPSAWLQPCLRSNKASWNLLSKAVQLATDIGAWNWNVDTTLASEEEQRQRKTMSVMLYIASQAAGVKFCVGPSNCAPPPASEFLQDSHDSMTNLWNVLAHVRDDRIAHTLWHWNHLTSIIKEADAKLFGNPTLTTEYITSGDYRQLAIDLDNKLVNSSKDLGQCQNLVTRNQRRIMNLDIQYCRILFLSICIRGIWYRVHQRSAGQPIVPPQVLHQEISKDVSAIQRILDAGQSFLETVITFHQDASLRYLPTHVPFRIVAVAFGLIKCFYMGVDSSCARKVLDLIHDVSEALKHPSAWVDDDHIGLKVGKILYNLWAQAKANLHREEPPTTKSKKHSRSDSSSPAENGHEAQRPKKTGPRKAAASSDVSRRKSNLQASTNYEHRGPTVGGHQTVRQQVPEFQPMDMNMNMNVGTITDSHIQSQGQTYQLHSSWAPMSLREAAQAAAHNIPMTAEDGRFGNPPRDFRDAADYQGPGDGTWSSMPWSSNHMQPLQHVQHQDPMQRMLSHEDDRAFQNITYDAFQPYRWYENTPGGNDIDFNYGVDPGTQVGAQGYNDYNDGAQRFVGDVQGYNDGNQGYSGGSHGNYGGGGT